MILMAQLFMMTVLIGMVIFNVYGDSSINDLSVEACIELGFEKETLSCKDCNRLQAALEDEDSEMVENFIASCKQCCVSLDDNVGETYLSAILTLDLDNLRSHPHLDTFVKRHAKNFADVLDIRNKWGKAIPELTLRHRNGNVKVLSIQGWKTEQIEQFLRDKVQEG